MIDVKNSTDEFTHRVRGPSWINGTYSAEFVAKRPGPRFGRKYWVSEDRLLELEVVNAIGESLNSLSAKPQYTPSFSAEDLRVAKEAIAKASERPSLCHILLPESA